MEKIPSVGFVKDDDRGIKAVDATFLSSETYRLTFFSKKFSNARGLRQCADENFIGYAILKGNQFKDQPVIRWTVFESVILSSRRKNNFIHTKRKYSVRAITEKFNVKGNIYCQQNVITSSCAHVALRTVMATALKSGDISYGSMNRLLRRKAIPYVPGDGLDSRQIKAILEDYGIHYYEQRFKMIPYQKYLYGSIENKFCALLGFRLKRSDGEDERHMIPILGHTFNEDTWVPNADISYFRLGKDTRYVASEAWVSTYICHDDNFGSNFCVPKFYVKEQPTIPLESHEEKAPETDDTKEEPGKAAGIEPEVDNADTGIYVLGTLPKGCQCDPIEAEAIACDYLYSMVPKVRMPDGNVWVQRLKDAVDRSWVVLRPTLISSKMYIKHLSEMRGWEDKANEKIDRFIIKHLKQHLKGDYWAVEVSFPELFPANTRKIGEILLYSNKKPTANRDFSSFVLARFPERFFFRGNTASGVADFIGVPSGIKTHTKILSAPEQ